MSDQKSYPHLNSIGNILHSVKVPRMACWYYSHLEDNKDLWIKLRYQQEFLQQRAQKGDRFWFIHILSHRFNPISLD